MSVLKTQHSEKRVGKGDARRDSFSTFQKNFPTLKKDQPLRGKLFLQKHTRTITTYPNQP